MHSSDISEPSAPTVSARDPSFSISEFCAAENLSHSKYYGLRRKGLGPKEMYLDGTVRITGAARRAWQQARENPPPEEKALIDQRNKQRSEHARRIGKLAAQSSRHVSNRKRQKGRDQ